MLATGTSIQISGRSEGHQQQDHGADQQISVQQHGKHYPDVNETASYRNRGLPLHVDRKPSAQSHHDKTQRDATSRLRQAHQHIAAHAIHQFSR